MPTMPPTAISTYDSSVFGPLDSTLRFRFTAEAGIVSFGIKFRTDSQLTHSELILPDGSYLGARAKGGVAIRPVNYNNPVIDLRYALKTTPENYAKAMAFAMAQVGKGYDFIDICGILVDRDWHEDSKWQCSELDHCIADQADIRLLNVDQDHYNMITPEMLHLSPKWAGNRYYAFHK